MRPANPLALCSFAVSILFVAAVGCGDDWPAQRGGTGGGAATRD